MRDYFDPVFFAWICNWGFDQFEILGLVVGADEEMVSIVVCCILQMRNSGLQNLKSCRRLICWDKTNLGTDCAFRMDQDEFFRFGFVDHAGKLLVQFLVDKQIRGGGATQNVLVNLKGAEGFWILLGIKNALLICCPDKISRYLRNLIFQKFMRV